MTPWLLDKLMCPRHQAAMTSHPDYLKCAVGCCFPIVNGVPVMLLDEVHQTIELAHASLRQSREFDADGDLYVDSVGLSEEEKRGILRLASTGCIGIDPVVSYLVGATNGIAYKHLVGRLNEYPIPRLSVSPSDGEVFLDIGCSWGRWSVAAARKGYRVVGVDPSLGAVMAAKRVARHFGTEAEFIVGDCRYLPFKNSVIDCAFSYSVLQHLSRSDASKAVSEISRVLKEGGLCLVQMPTKFGLRCIYHQLRRRFRDGERFEVRYWSLPSLKKLFTARIGKTRFSVDCFFGIGLQFSDLRFMTPILKPIVAFSEFLRIISRFFPPLIWVADSVYVSSVKEPSYSTL